MDTSSGSYANGEWAGIGGTIGIAGAEMLALKGAIATGGGLLAFASRNADKAPDLLKRFRPTQSARHFDMAKVDEYAEMTRKGTWDWSENKTIVDEVGNIVSGHHRVLAAARAGVDIPDFAIYQMQGVTTRQVYDWADILGL